jgi:integrase
VQPYGKQEERHPDLSQELYLVHVPNRGAYGLRPDQHVRGYVAQDQGQPEPSRYDTLQEGGLVQELLGHATIAMTLDTYSHFLPSMGIRP